MLRMKWELSNFASFAFVVFFLISMWFGDFGRRRASGFTTII